MKKLFLALAMSQLIFSCQKDNDDPAPVSSFKLLGGSDEDVIVDLIPASDGGILMVAETESNKTGDVGANHGGSDVWVVKLNSNADTVWTRTMGGSNAEHPAGAIATSDGGFIVAATTYSGNSGDVVGIPNGGWASDFWIVKLKSNGDTAWTRLAGTTDQDQANCMAATPDGGFVVAGTNDPMGSSQDVFVIKFNSNGNTVWQKTFGGSYDDVTNAVSVAADGSILLAVSTESDNTGDVPANHGSHDSWIIKLTSNGDKVWSKMFGGDEEEDPASIQSTSDGGCIIAGYTASSQNGDVTGKNHGAEDMWVLKLNAGGDISWNSLFGGSNLDGTLGKTAIATTADGGYVIVGTSASSDGDVGTNQGDYDCWVIKLNSTGSKVRSKTFGGSQYDVAASILLNADGSCWVGGLTTSNNSGDVGANHGNGDVWMIKIKDF